MPQNNCHPAQNIQIVLNELKRYSIKLYNKPRWLVFNKIDLFTSRKVNQIINEIQTQLKIKEKYYFISSLKKAGIKKLCLDISKYLEKEKKNPRSTPKSNIKRHRCAFKAKQNNHSRKIPLSQRKVKGNMISLCNEFSNPLTLLLLGAPAFEQQDYGRTRESRNKKEKV